MHPLLSYLYWNPDKDIFTIPLINRPIAWYGFFFVLGLIICYGFVLSIIRSHLQENGYKDVKETAQKLTDRLTWFVIIGIVVGARLGHVFFYDWPYYQRTPQDIFKIWEGGLASHGGVLGILLAIFFFKKSIAKKFPTLTFWTIVDTIAIPASLAAVCIRIGNFFNQEILGTPSQMPWAVIFGNPADRTVPIPRHPVQIYEALAYLCIFVILWNVWKYTHVRLKPGFVTGLFFILLFTARFFLEFFKSSQSIVIDESQIQMGQYLSIPFIFCGIFLLFYSGKGMGMGTDQS